MEYWNKGFPYWWKGTTTQEGGNEYWYKGFSTVEQNSSKSDIQPPAILRVDGVLRTDISFYDGSLNVDSQSVVGVSNV